MSNQGGDVPENSKGLVCAYHISEQGEARELSFKDVKKINEKPEGDGWVWLHFDLDEKPTTKWLNKYKGMLASVAQALGSVRTRPRSYVFDRGVLLILRGINLNAGEKAENMLSLRLWMNDKIVITTRREKLMAVDAIRKEIIAGKCPQTPAHLVIGLVQGLIERITVKVETLDDAITALEDNRGDTTPEALQKKVQTIRSQAITLLRHITPQKPALAELVEAQTPYLDTEQRGSLRVLTSRISGDIGELMAVRDRAEAMQAAIASQQAERLNKTMYLLAIISVFFLPLSLFTGLLGINVGGMPGEGWTPSFNIVLILMAVMGGATWWIMRKLKFI